MQSLLSRDKVDLHHVPSSGVQVSKKHSDIQDRLPGPSVTGGELPNDCAEVEETLPPPGGGMRINYDGGPRPQDENNHHPPFPNTPSQVSTRDTASLKEDSQPQKVEEKLL